MESKTQNWGNRFNQVISIIVGLFFLVILGVIVLGQPSLRFAYNQRYALDNLMVLPLTVAVLLLCLWLRNRFASSHVHESWWHWMPAVYFPALLVIQLVVARSIWFYPGWDVLSVYDTSGKLAAGLAFDSDYFRLCPNNAPLAVLLAAPIWIALRLGMAVPYVVLPYLSEVMVNLACLFCVLNVYKLTRSRLARLGAYFFCTVWIALSLTSTIPYTDTFSVLFPMLALFIYLSNLRPFVKWMLVSLACFFGASFKPTVMIFEVALILLSIMRALPFRGWTRKRWLHAGTLLVAIILGAVPGVLWQNTSTTMLAGSAQPQEQLSETHYLMLGMNEKTYGGHSPEDVAFSQSFPTLAERRSANIQRAWERLSSRTVLQNLYFFTVKGYKAFSDGTLAANQSYLAMEVPARTDPLSRFLKQVYFAKRTFNPWYNTLMQMLWFAVLILCIIAMVGRQRHNPVTSLLALTLFGVGFYLLLFEPIHTIYIP